ncbi:MAG: glutamine synthetase III [Lachnospira sp.]|nr:glutamine synthetase III [Lachnospira sp.]
MQLISDYFGCMVFNDKVMKETLEPEVYQSLRRTIEDGRSLNLSVANAVATAMKDWAIGLSIQCHNKKHCKRIIRIKICSCRKHKRCH